MELERVRSRMMDRAQLRRHRNRRGRSHRGQRQLELRRSRRGQQRLELWGE